MLISCFCGFLKCWSVGLLVAFSQNSACKIARVCKSFNSGGAGDFFSIKKGRDGNQFHPYLPDCRNK